MTPLAAMALAVALKAPCPPKAPQSTVPAQHQRADLCAVRQSTLEEVKR